MSEHVPDKPRGLSILPMVFFGAILLLVVWFALQNAEMVTFQFATWSWEVSLALLLFVCVFLGIVLTALALAPGWFRGRQHRTRLEKRIRELEKGKAAAEDRVARLEQHLRSAQAGKQAAQKGDQRGD